MTRRAYSLQARLAWLVLGLLVAVWSAMAAITWFDARHEVEEILDSHLAQAAALVMAQQDAASAERRIDTPALHRYAYKTTIQVFREGRLVLRSANAPMAPLLDVAGSGAQEFRTLRIDGRVWRVFAVRDAAARLEVYVGEEEDSRNAILWAVLRSTLWPLVAALPLLVLAVWWATRRGLRPMRLLGRSLVERRPDALDRVRIDAAPSEMVPMIDALNALFQRIERLLEAERRFTADAAHELRTPIAAIRTHAQVAMNEADDARRRHALQGMLDGCDRAARLVEQMLVLARLETDAIPEDQPVDLCAVAQSVLAEIAPRALARRQVLALDADGPCVVRGDETLLAVLVRNLVDNALRYSLPGARVQVRMACCEAGASLVVEDEGPGLAAADLPRLGERFFRALGSEQTGSGLGLSIVRRIAAAHRMTLEIGRSASLGGLAIELKSQPGKVAEGA
ncbi:ATP-binding protein [Variovorax sp. KK3]|uniref:ATP-binding protein n=1 Tax=Variovorax sp. KK3 TaxID=1855728 RepID=UPI00097C39C6|nr:ATP-binding protein [Variovorax sp. KK3]